MIPPDVEATVSSPLAAMNAPAPFTCELGTLSPTGFQAMAYAHQLQGCSLATNTVRVARDCAADRRALRTKRRY